jgi:hypothetical protein
MDQELLFEVEQVKAPRPNYSLPYSRSRDESGDNSDRPARAGGVALRHRLLPDLRFSLAPACADPRVMKGFQRVVGTEVGITLGACEPVF